MRALIKVWVYNLDTRLGARCHLINLHSYEGCHSYQIGMDHTKPSFGKPVQNALEEGEQLFSRILYLRRKDNTKSRPGQLCCKFLSRRVIHCPLPPFCNADVRV